MLDAICTYCGGPTKVKHKLYMGSCLCETCNESDDITYYEHKWMKLSEAEALEKEAVSKLIK